MKNTLLLILFLMVGCFGCKPKETTITGQIFIVTRASENIKLGLVDVRLIEKQQVLEFYKKGGKLDVLKTELRMAKIAAEEARKKCDDFSVNDPRKQPLYLQTLSARDEWVWNNAQLEAITDKKARLESEVEQAQEDDEAFDGLFKRIREKLGGAQKLKVTQEELQEFLKSMPEEIKSIPPAPTNEFDALNAKLESIESPAKLQEEKLNEELQNADLRVRIGEANLESYVWKCFDRVIPVVASDADGKFALHYPRGQELVACAKAERIVGEQTAKYFWLVELPKDAESAQILLSNNNFLKLDEPIQIASEK